MNADPKHVRPAMVVVFLSGALVLYSVYETRVLALRWRLLHGLTYSGRGSRL